MSGWMVVRVRPNQVARAIENMERQGCECYAPRGLVRSGPHNRQSVKYLFPGYVFARHAHGQWNFLRGTFGVLDVIMATSDGDPYPARMPASEIDKLRSREEGGLVQLPEQALAAGDAVSVDSGGLVLADAIYDGMSGRDRCFVLMQAMGRWARVEVAASDVSPR